MSSPEGKVKRRPGPVIVLLLLGGMLGTPAVRADPAEDPFALVQEEQTVIGAAKRPQPLSEMPSSVSVITAEEIRAHGYRTLAEALRWVRGVFVTYDRNYSYVAVRGLLRPGDYNNKVLLTLDGHALNGNVFADAAFGRELGLDMEAVERIEIVRGPGSALFGTNAVLAVVNVVTRAASREPGVTVSGERGGPGERRGYVSIGSAGPGGPRYHLGGSWLAADGRDLHFAEYDDPATHDGRAVGADGESGYGLLGQFEWGALSLVGKLNQRMKRIPTGAYGTTFGDRRTRTYDGRDFVELSGRWPLSPAVELNVRTYWDGVRYYGYYVYGPDTATVVNFDRGDGDLVGTEWRVHWCPAPRRVVTAGIEAQRHTRVDLENYDLSPYVVYDDQRRAFSRFGGYVQEERRIGASATLTTGARVDQGTTLEAEVSPRVEWVWHPSTDLRWSLSLGTAFRAPNVYEEAFQFYPVVPNPGLRPERVTTLEAGLVRILGPWTTSLSAYGSRIRGLIDLMPIDTLGTLQFLNRQRVESHGVESEVAASPRPGTRARLAVAWQESRDRSLNAEMTNSPRWNVQLVLTQSRLDRRASAGFGLRYLSPRSTLAGNHTDPALVADARLGMRIAPGAEAGLESRNLFDARYGDPAQPEHLEDQIPQDSRSVYFTLTYRAPFRH
jgi:iron complex outermembrane receptor protein